MYKLAVFDLDGTILDTLDDLATAVQYALKVNGLATRSKEEVRSFVGNGIANLIQRAAGENAKNTDKVLADFKAYYKENCSVYTKPYEGIMELLTALKNRGLKLALLSNKADFAVKKLAAEYFGDLLAEAVGENEAAGIRKKPAPYQKDQKYK